MKYSKASYETMIIYAQLLRHKEAKLMLQNILEEEKNADKLLSKIAKTTK